MVLLSLLLLLLLAQLCAAEPLKLEVPMDMVLGHRHFLRSLEAQQADAEIGRRVVYELHESFGEIVEPLFEHVFRARYPDMELLADGRDVVCSDDIEVTPDDPERDYRVAKRPDGPPCRLDEVTLVFRVRSGADRPSMCIGVPVMSIFEADDSVPGPDG